MKQISYTKAAIKTLKRMPANTSKNIRAKVEAYAADPASLANNVTAMKGFEGYVRLRVGGWRVVMKDGAVVLVVRVGPRGDVYKGEPL